MSKNHIVPLGCSTWGVWRQAILRSAGFAASGVVGLGSERLWDIATELFTIESDMEDARVAALAACADRIKNNTGDDVTVATNTAKHLRACRMLKRNTGLEEIDCFLETLRTQAKEKETLQKVFDKEMSDHNDVALDVLKTYAEMPAFREALTWQNRNALESAVDGFLSAPKKMNAKARERARLIAKYIQRYTVKNDSIGFFGPITWADVSNDTDFDWKPGPLIVKRQVSYEYWAIRGLAETLSADSRLRHAFLPRRKPTLWLEGQLLYGAHKGAPEEVDSSTVALIDACEGAARAVDLAAMLVSKGHFESVEAVFLSLENLARRGVVSWALEVPASIDNPMEWLRKLLQGVDDEKAKQEVLGLLNKFDDCKDELAKAAGTPALADAIVKFEKLFKEKTHLDSKRGHGEVYASRQIFFEDCVRGGSLTVGRSLLDELDKPLSFLLDSSRWYTYQLGKRFHAAFLTEYRKQAKATSNSKVRFADFLAGASRNFVENQYSISPIVTAVRNELMRRWGECLGIDEAIKTRKAVHIRSSDIEKLVSKAFAAPGPGWIRGRYQSPDIMIAASSASAIAAGDFLAVLGESHAGTNTLLGLFFQTQHPNRDEIVRFYDADMRVPCVQTTMGRANRALKVSFSLNDHHIEFGAGRSFLHRDNVHFLADLYVEESGDRLLVKSRVKDIEFDAINVMERYVAADVESHFDIMPKLAYTPRVTIDKVVMSREAWRFKRTDFAPLWDGNSKDNAMAVMRWARSHGMPRYVFAKVSNEPKPFYVDWSSPLLVDVFLRFLKKAKSLSISEMLPSHGEHWLEDEDGMRYTSELRFAAVDPIEWKPEFCRS